MRRFAVLAGTLVGVIIGVVIGTALLDNTDAQDTRALDLRLMHYVDADAFSAEGDDCRIPHDEPSPAITGGKLVVRDETGTIILVSDQYRSTLETSSVGDRLVCRIETTIDLPDAAFYSLWWGDVWLTAYPADALPLDEPLEVVPGIS